MNKYTVLEASNADDLSAEVTKRLNMPGWFLVGGLSVVKENKSEATYSQAMVYDEGQLKRHVQKVARPK